MGRLVRDDRKATVTQITTRYNQGMQNTISECTTLGTLKQMGYSSRRPHRVLLLSAKNRKQRLQFTQAHQNWTIEDWKKVAWSDEPRFLLQHSDSRVRICRPLVPIEHHLNTVAYLSIVAYRVHPFMTTVYFQQDNAPCHKTQIISDWFLEHDNEFTLLKWPPQSSDLNSTEHLWDVVEREIRIMDVQPINLQQLRDAVMSIWTKIAEESF